MSTSKLDYPGSQVTPTIPSSATEKFYHRDGARRRRELLITTGSIKSPQHPSLLASSRALQRSTSFGKSASSRPKKQPTQIAPIMHNVDSFERLRVATQAYTLLGSSGHGTTPSSSSTATPRSTVSSRGQQFTVASVGNNGMLYLRPVTRPQPGKFVTLPSTPPKTAEEPEEDPDSKKSGSSSLDSKSTEAPKTPPETPRRAAAAQEPPSSPPIPRIKHSRARSFSTIGEMSAPQDSQPKSAKTVIEKIEPPRRPRTAVPNQSHPHLEVAIPHYSLGSPNFSPSGTPYLFGSSLPPNSMLATKGATSAWSQNTEFNWIFPTAENRDAHFQSQHLGPPAPTSRLSLMSTPLASGIISPVVASAPIMMCGQQVISPSIYDTLSFPPGSDHPSIVKHDPRTNEIVAATPSRIIAQITSATFLDYQLLSDFFLTFRAFLTPSDLVSHLLVRLRWAIDRDDDVGKVVRVRTFVAIRHWLLNYFADDFVPSLDLREQFCIALNELSNDVRGRRNANQSDMKIIGELKKCWRRTCALYWDGVPGGGIDGADAGVEADIKPGGSAGSRDDPKVLAELFDEEFKAKNAKPSLNKRTDRLGVVPNSNITSGATERFIREVISSGGRKSAGSRSHKKGKQKKKENDPRSSGKGKGREDPISGGKSSSLPGFASKKSGDRPTNGKSGKAYAGSGPRPSAPHKRSGSFTDALRDDRQPLSMKKQSGKPIQLFMSVPFAGSLVRGNLIPPTPAVVEIIAPSTPTEKVLLGPNVSAGGRDQPPHPHHHKIAALRGPGVKKLLGNVKRALSGRITSSQHDSSDEQGPPEELARYVASKGKQATLTGILSRSGSYGSIGPGGQRTRIDLLGAGVVEAFHRALDDQIKVVKTQKEAVEAVRKAYTESKGKAIQGIGPNEPVTPERAMPEDAVSVDSGDSDGEGEKNTALRPAPRLRSNHRATRSKSADLMIEGGSSKRYKKSFSFGRVAMEAWAEKGVVTPSPSASIASSARKSHSLSYDGSPRSILKRMRNHHTSGDMASPTGRSVLTSNEGSLLSYNSSKLIGGFGSRNYGGEPSRRLGDLTDAPQEGDDMEETNEGVSTAPSSARRPLGRDPFDRPPARMLRRRPGGDLKAAATIGDLEPDTRPQSGTSFGTYSESVVSVWPKVNHSLYAQNPIQGVLSLGAVTLGAPVKALTRGKSRLRYSTTKRSSGAESCASAPETFEAGVLKLADLPDTTSEDGGIEVALMKLEGTYRKTDFERPIVDGRRASDGILSTTTTRDLGDEIDIVVKEEEVYDMDEEEEEDDRFEESDNDDESDDDDDYSDLYEDFVTASGSNLLGLQQKQKRMVNHEVLDGSNVETPRASHNLLKEGDAIEPPLSFINARNESNEFVPILDRGQNTDMLSLPDTADMGHSSISLRDIQKDLLGSRTSDLNDDGQNRARNDDMSDVSSELSVDLMAKRKRASVSSSVLPNLTPGAIMSELNIPSHPLRHPPSPPLTTEAAVSMSPASDTAWPLKNRTRTPEANLEVLESLQRTPSKPSQKTTKRLRKATEPDQRFHATSIHLPFILAYDSELLAKQFTLIEKDALTEIDWKELVELRWKQTTSPVTDWVEFLRSQQSRGVEVVIARFNLMVKWAESEIVMTRSIDERARTISKLIHIAAHARRLQNFATMYQITIALLSADVARLQKTWQLVSHANMRTLRELETLVQPIRNFHNLRSEMDTVTGETGCIPFVGLYTHDLIYNAQRPSQITGTPAGPPLVNFERHRTTAAIVKRLLRLIEASQKYDFQTVDGVCERCLWIAALKDEEINKLSLEIENDL